MNPGWLKRLLDQLGNGVGDKQILKSYPQLKNDSQNLEYVKAAYNKLLNNDISYDDVKEYLSSKMPDVKFEEENSTNRVGNIAQGSGQQTNKGFATFNLSALNHPSNVKEITPLYEHSSQDDADPIGTTYNNVNKSLNDVTNQYVNLQNSFQRPDATSVSHPTMPMSDISSKLNDLSHQRNSLVKTKSQIENVVNKTGLDVPDNVARNKVQQWVQSNPQNQNIDPDRFGVNELKQLAPKDLTSQALLKTYENNRAVRTALDNSSSFSQAVIKWAKQAHPELAKDLDAQTEGTDSPDLVDNSQLGTLTKEFLQQPYVQQYAQKGQQQWNAVSMAKRNFVSNFPKLASTDIASKLSNEREQNGDNNFLINIKNPSNIDALAKKMYDDGKLSFEEYQRYQKDKNNILGQMQDSGFISTVGNNLDHAIYKTLLGNQDMWHGILGVGDNAEDIRAKNEEKYNQVGFKPKGDLHDISYGSGKFTADIVPMMLVTKGLTGLGMGTKTANALSMALAANHDIHNEALDMFPDDPSKQRLYTTALGVLNGGFGALVSREKPLEGLQKLLGSSASTDFKDGVLKTINDFTENKITADAAKENYLNLVQKLVDKIPQYASKSIKQNTVQAAQMSLMNAAQMGAQQLFGGKNYSANDYFDSALSAGKLAFLGGLPLSVLGAHSDITNESKIGATYVYEMASDPLRYKALVDNLAQTDPQFSREAFEIKNNLETAIGLKAEMDKNPMLNALSTDDKQKYLFQSLSQKILEKQLGNTTDNVLRKKIKEQIKQSENFNQRLIDKTPLDIKELSIKEKEAGIKPYYEDEQNVSTVAEKISKGLPLSNEDLQLHKNFPNEVETELNKIYKNDISGTEKEPEVLQTGTTTENNGGSETNISDNEEGAGETQAVPEAAQAVNKPLIGAYRPKPFTTKSGNVVKYENGKRVVTDQDGNPVNNRQQIKALDEHSKKFNYNFGDRAIDSKQPPLLKTESEANRWIAENSNNPSEIASVYLAQPKEPVHLSKKEQAIADYGIGKVTQSSYNQFGDRNNINFSKARTYFSKEGMPIDSVAKSIADHSGLDITPQDVVNFIDRFPSGTYQALKNVETDVHASAKQRFEELTGIPLNEKTARIASEQAFTPQEVSQARKAIETEPMPEDALLRYLKEEAGFINDNNDSFNLDIENNGQSSTTNIEQPASKEGVSISPTREKTGTSGSGEAKSSNRQITEREGTNSHASAEEQSKINQGSAEEIRKISELEKRLKAFEEKTGVKSNSPNTSSQGNELTLKEESHSYETEVEGQEVRYRSISVNDNYTQGDLFDQEQSPSERTGRESEYDRSTVRAVWSKDKNIQLTGKTKVEGHADVAHIFRMLESKGVEHGFVVHIDKEGNSHIQLISIGGLTGTVMDPRIVLQGVKQFGSEKVYLVHNHPSGNLKPSNADMQLTRKVSIGLNGIPVEHVLMDTLKAEYTLLDEYGDQVGQFKRNEENQENKPLETHKLNDVEVLSEPIAYKITSSADAAKAIQQLRFSALPKRGLLLLDQSNNIVGVYFLPDMSYETVTDKLSQNPIAVSVIFFGNERINDIAYDANNLKEPLNGLDVKILDAISIDKSPFVDEAYKSAADEGLLREVEAKYATGGTVNDSNSLDDYKDFIKEEIEAGTDESLIKHLLSNKYGFDEKAIQQVINDVKFEFKKPTTGIKKSIVEQEREKLEIDKVNFSRLSDKEIMALGKALVEEKQIDPRAITEQIANGKPRPLSAAETAALVYYKANLENEIFETSKKLDEAIASEDQGQELVHRERLETLEQERKNYFVLSDKTGYEQSASFRLRKLILDNELNATYHEMKYRANNNGDIPPNVLEKFKQLEKDYKALQEQMKNLEEQKSLRAAELFVKKEKEKLELEQRKQKRVVKTEQIDNRINQITTNIREKLKTQRSRLNANPVPVEIIPDLISLAKEYIKKGIVSAEGIVDEMYHELKEDLEDITKRDLRDALSGYGRTKQPTQNQVEAQLSEAKRQMQLLSALEDARKGEPPLRTGFQRPKPSDRVRELQRKVAQAIKDNGIVTKDSEQQLKSALDAAKTRLRNQILDIEKQIETGEKTPKKSAVQYDDEANALKEIRDSLKRQLEAIEGKPELTDEQRVKLATSMLERSIKDYERRISEKDFTKKENKTSERPELEQLKKVRDELKSQYSDLKDAEGITEQQRLKSYRSQLQTRIEEYERRLRERDFTTPEKNKLALTDEEINLQAKLNRIRNQFEEEHLKLERSKRSGIKKLLDFLVYLKREMVISSVTTLGKLTTAGTLRQIQTPLENVNGQILHLLLPGLSKKALLEGGGFNVAAEIAGVKKYASSWVDLFKRSGSMLDTIKRGKSELDEAYGERKLPEEMVSYVGRIHGALKDPVKQAEFIRALKILTDNAVRDGLDLSSPSVQKAITDKAYFKARASIFMNPNLATELYRSLITQLEKKGAKGKLVSTLAQVELPVVTVPTNFVNEILKVGYGGVHASVKSLQVLFTTGFKNIKPEDADYIMSALKKQGIGVAMYLLGYYGYQNIGGYYTGKRKEDEPKAGDLIFFGIHLPHWAVHSPMLEPLQMGATLRRMQIAEEHHKKQEGTTEGLYQATWGAVKQTPFIETPKRLLDAAKNGESLSGHLGELVKSEILPPDLQKVAASNDTDEYGNAIKRKPKGFVENIEVGIPGLREKVGMSSESDLKKAARNEIIKLLKAGTYYTDVPKELKDKANIDRSHLREFIQDAKLPDDLREFKNKNSHDQLLMWQDFDNNEKERFGKYLNKMERFDALQKEKPELKSQIDEIRTFKRKMYN